jgi:hypothetical protein
MPKFELKTTLSVLEDLGINNYTNAAAVLSEIVANAWDADASNVSVKVAGTGPSRSLTIEDDGIGMTATEVNDRYLTVGFKRRETTGGGRTPTGRPVMGRKGIGKLAVFSIASKVEVHTVSGKSKNAFSMDLADLRAAAKAHKPYYPKEITSAADLSRGTRIVLRALSPSLALTDRFLRRHLSRRFTVIDGAHGFTVSVNGNPLTLADREYYSKLQYIWHYNMPQLPVLATAAEQEEARPFEIVVPNKGGKPTKYSVSGWLATVKQRSQLASPDDDNLNRLSLVVRGKLAHENFLEEFSEAGVYATYLIGEVNADFLDIDEKPDIATPSRQRIVESDPRYVALKTFIQAELKHIENSWTAIRNQTGLDTALEIPAIFGWYNGLQPSEQKIATLLLGRVNTLPIEPSVRGTLFKQAVLSFEVYRVKNNLEALEAMTSDQLGAVAEVFNSIDDIEAALYLQLVRQRLGIINVFDRLVDENRKEAYLQNHVFNHLWLLNTAWEHATENAVMEKSVLKMIEEATGKATSTLSKEVASSRVDIRYRLVSGRHVIIELKRAKIVTNTPDLLRQIQKYAAGMRNLLANSGFPNEAFEIIILVGKPLSDWKDYDGAKEVSRQIFAPHNARVMLYEEVLRNAKTMYGEFAAREKDASKIGALLESIEESDIPSSGILVPGTKKKILPQTSVMKPIVRKSKA